MKAVGAAVLAFSVLGLSPPGRSISAPMPTRIFSGGGRSVPIWVAASIALREGGKTAAPEFDIAGKSSMEGYLAADEKDGCIQEGVTLLDTVGDSRIKSNLDSAVDTTDLVLVGRVTGIEPGFYLGIPGQLYRIDVTKTLKGRPKRGFYFAFLPIGTIPLGSRHICKTDPRFPIGPTLGRRVVVFTSVLGGIEGELLEIYGPEDIVVEREDGSAWITPGFVAQNPKLSTASFTDVLSEVEMHLAKEGGSK